MKKAGGACHKRNSLCERVSQFSLAKQQSFDAALTLGIVHHLDDQEERHLFQIAYDALKSGGKQITFDGVWTNDACGAVVSGQRSRGLREK